MARHVPSWRVVMRAVRTGGTDTGNLAGAAYRNEQVISALPDGLVKRSIGGYVCR